MGRLAGVSHMARPSWSDKLFQHLPIRLIWGVRLLKGENRPRARLFLRKDRYHTLTLSTSGFAGGHSVQKKGAAGPVGLSVACEGEMDMIVSSEYLKSDSLENMFI